MRAPSEAPPNNRRRRRHRRRRRDDNGSGEESSSAGESESASESEYEVEIGKVLVRLGECEKERKQRKRRIKKWVEDFKREHGGVDPSKEDKQGVRGMYEEFQASSNLQKELEAKLRQLKEEKRAAEATAAVEEEEEKGEVPVDAMKETKEEGEEPPLLPVTTANSNAPPPQERSEEREVNMGGGDPPPQQQGRLSVARRKTKKPDAASASADTTQQKGGEGTPAPVPAAAAASAVASPAAAAAGGGSDARAARAKRMMSMRKKFEAMRDDAPTVDDLDESFLAGSTPTVTTGKAGAAPPVTMRPRQRSSAPKPTVAAMRQRFEAMRKEQKTRESTIMGGAAASARAGDKKNDASSVGPDGLAVPSEIPTGRVSVDSEGGKAVESLLTAASDDIPRPQPMTDTQDIILHLKTEIEEDEVPAYQDRFDSAMPEHELVVASLSAEEVQRREEEMEAGRIEAAEIEARKYAEREADLHWREQKARGRVELREQQSEQRVAQLRLQTQERAEGHERALARQFLRAQDNLKRVVETQQAHIVEKYGELMTGEQSAARRFHVNWDLIPQPVEVRLQMMRAVKDKLPRGNYVFLLTLYDRLGGRPLLWSQLGGSGAGATKPGATRPFAHGGRFYNRELRIDQSVFALCPSQHVIRPAMVFVFEMFRLAGPRNPTDKVVGWCVLPLCNPQFQVVQGQFRIPVLRGDFDLTIDRHSTIESLYAKDLSAWLSNLYIEIRHLPRETYDMHGQLHREYDVEFDFMNKLLRIGDADRTYKPREVGDIESGKLRDVGPLLPKPAKAGHATWWQRKSSIFNHSDAKTRAQIASRNRHLMAGLSMPGSFTSLLKRMASKLSPRGHHDAEEKDDMHTPLPSGVHVSPRGGGGGGAARARGDGQLEEKEERDGGSAGEEEEEEEEEGRRRQGAHSRGNYLGEARTMSSDLQGRSEAVRRRKGEGSRWDEAGVGLNEDSAETRKHEKAEASKSIWTRISNSQELEYFTMAVCPEPGKHNKGTAGSIARSKLRYLRQEVTADLGLSNWKSSDFWMMVLVFVIAAWLRMYFHYIGQWIFLKANDIAVFGFDMLWNTCPMKYVSATITTDVELGLVAMGPITLIVMFLLFNGVGYAMQKALGQFPDIGSRFVISWGVVTVLDPVLILAVDVISHNYDCRALPACAVDYTSADCACVEGDAFKLWNRMLTDEGSGVVGLFLTLIVYAGLGTIALFVFYNYLIYVHMNGRMLDVYRRLHGHSETFFLPHDFELSMDELEYICSRAKRWQGIRGETRKVCVCDYVLTDPLHPDHKETTTHLAIYTMASPVGGGGGGGGDGGAGASAADAVETPDLQPGERQPYRHFLRTHDGAIMEMFDDMTKSFGAQFRALENLLLSDADNAGSPSAGGFFAGMES